MSRIARYGKAVAKAGHGPEVAAVLLDAAGELESDPGCELYLVSHEAGDADAIWVTELWRDQAALDASLERARAADGPRRVMELVDSFAVVELELLGGKGPADTA